MIRLERNKMIQAIYQKAIKNNYDMLFFNLPLLERLTDDRLISKYKMLFESDLNESQKNIKNMCDAWLNDFRIIVHNDNVLRSCTSIIKFSKLDFSLSIPNEDLKQLKYFYTEKELKLLSMVSNDNQEKYINLVNVYYN